MMQRDNFEKHKSSNPIKRYLIQRFHRAIISLVQELEISSIVEVGCGEGFVLSELHDAKMASSIEGIDNDPIAIEIANQIHPELKINHGDILNLPYQSSSIDLVICCEVLEHIDSPEKALQELARVTRRYCLLSVPNEPFFKICGYLRMRTPESMGHINFWTSSKFTEFVSSCFSVKSVRNPFPWTIVLAEIDNSRDCAK